VGEGLTTFQLKKKPTHYKVQQSTSYLAGFKGKNYETEDQHGILNSECQNLYTSGSLTAVWKKISKVQVTLAEHTADQMRQGHNRTCYTTVKDPSKFMYGDILNSSIYWFKKC
jgi:hypothetical protein